VRASDYSTETIESERQYHGGSACIGAATAEVTGDGLPDYAFLITNDTHQTRLVVARPQPHGHLKLSRVMDFGTAGPGDMFVNALKPGTYEDLYSKDEAPAEFVAERGRVEKYVSARPGFVAGTIGSSAIAFFWTGTRWVHLWLSD